jgi:hypothetical protein
MIDYSIPSKIRTQQLPDNLRPLFTTEFISLNQLNTLRILRLLTEYEHWLLISDSPF